MERPGEAEREPEPPAAPARSASPAAAVSGEPSTSAGGGGGGDGVTGTMDEHVIVWLRPTGDAPILKQQRVRVARTDPFARVVAALRSKTRAPSVLAYLREAFVPPLDARVGDLAAAYGTHGGGRLTVNYALAPAWG